MLALVTTISVIRARTCLGCWTDTIHFLRTALARHSPCPINSFYFASRRDCQPALFSCVHFDSPCVYSNIDHIGLSVNIFIDIIPIYFVCKSDLYGESGSAKITALPRGSAGKAESPRLCQWAVVARTRDSQPSAGIQSSIFTSHSPFCDHSHNEEYTFKHRKVAA